MIYRMSGNWLDPPAPGVQLNAQRFQKDTQVSYSLIVLYYASKWLFIKAGESLVLLVDGERWGLSGEGSSGHRDVVRGGSVVEQAWYHDITLEELRQIANARRIDVKVKGDPYYVTKKFTQYNFRNFRRFVEEYGKPDPY